VFSSQQNARNLQYNTTLRCGVENGDVLEYRASSGAEFLVGKRAENVFGRWYLEDIRKTPNQIARYIP
jgi:hypothetical protein